MRILYRYINILSIYLGEAMRDIVDILKEAGYGVVEGKEEVLKKIKEIGSTSTRMPEEGPRSLTGAFK